MSRFQRLREASCVRNDFSATCEAGTHAASGGTAEQATKNVAFVSGHRFSDAATP